MNEAWLHITMGSPGEYKCVVVTPLEGGGIVQALLPITFAAVEQEGAGGPPIATIKTYRADVESHRFVNKP